MTLLPIAAPTTPAAGAGTGEATATSGDFAALLALVAGTTPSPNGETASPEVAPPAAPLEPRPDPVEESGRDQAMPPDAVAVVVMPMPMLLDPVAPAVRIAAPAGPPLSAPSRPADRPMVRVPVPPPAVEASPALAEAPQLPANGTPVPPAPPVAEPLPAAAAGTPAAAAKAPPSPIGLPPVEFEATPAPVEGAPAEVVPPGRGRPSVTVAASPVAAEASPALEETPPAPAPAPAPDAVVGEALGQPPGPPTRPERATVREPAAPMAIEASPALFAARPIAEVSPAVSENSVQEHRVPDKPRPPVTTQVSTPLPAPVTRTEGTLPVDAPAPATAAPPAVPEQIVSAVVPLHGRGDGRHEVTIELRPEDLGPIRVEVSVEQQTVHLTLHAAEPATGRLLSAALADLRTALADAGLKAGHLAVSPDGGSATGRRSRPGPPPAEKARDDSVTSERVRPVRLSAAGRLDLLL